MCMNKRPQSGFTLLELIVFIVIVGIGLAGILAVVNNAVRSSGDPMQQKQAIALADSVLEEVLLKAYCDPVNATVDPSTHLITACGANTAKANRAAFNNVDDYIGASAATFSDLPTNLSATYAIAVAVADATGTLGVISKRVTVTVTYGGIPITATGYRANF